MITNTIILNIRNILLDLAWNPHVHFVYCFRITQNTSLDKFDLRFITSVLYNSFVFENYDNSYYNCNKIEPHCVPLSLSSGDLCWLQIERNGLSFIFGFEDTTSNNYFFFLYFNFDRIINIDDFSKFYSKRFFSTSNLFTDFFDLSCDSFFSFEVFCHMNDISIFPISFYFPDNLYKFCLKCFKQTLIGFGEWFVFLEHFLSDNFHLSNVTFVLGRFPWFPHPLTLSNDILSHKSFYYFYDLSCFAAHTYDFHSFDVLSGFKMVNDSLVWNFFSLLVDKQGAARFSSPSVKSFETFSLYCGSSKLWLGNLYQRKRHLVPVFNFSEWFDLAVKCLFFSVCGYLVLDKNNFAFQVYTFMQYRLLRYPVHCVYSRLNLSENKLYFWMLVDDSASLLQPIFDLSADRDIHFSFIDKITSAFSFFQTKEFLYTFLSYKPVDESFLLSQQEQGIIDNYLKFDLDLTCFYIGIYNVNYYVSSRLHLSLQSLRDFFFDEDYDYTIGVCYLDIERGDPFDVYKKYTVLGYFNHFLGKRVDERIWLFTSPLITTDMFS